MNVAASIRARLTNISRNENIAFQVIIVRYLHERLLYRLSRSRFVNQLYLKGGNLLYILQGISTRPTVDVDFLGHSLSGEPTSIKNMMEEIASISCNDGVWFDTRNIFIERLTGQNLYSGIRLVFPAGFHTIKQNLQIDIGFGDRVIPNPVRLNFPVLLDDLPVPEILAYTPETVIAEKFHAMIELSVFNSRMKDFFDVYQLLETEQYDDKILKQAVSATFQNRQTFFSENHALFTDEFANNTQRNRDWQAFLKKINRGASLQFPKVMKEITRAMKPICGFLPTGTTQQVAP